MMEAQNTHSNSQVFPVRVHTHLRQSRCVFGRALRLYSHFDVDGCEEDEGWLAGTAVEAAGAGDGFWFTVDPGSGRCPSFLGPTSPNSVVYWSRMSTLFPRNSFLSLCTSRFTWAAPSLNGSALARTACGMGVGG